MRVTTDGQFERTDLWREGKWLDLWSVVHLLTGVSVGIGLPVFQFNVGYAIAVAFLGFVAYELWEAVVRIEETPQNRVMDVVVGMVSFLPFFLLTLEMSFLDRLYLFVPVLAINVALSWVGWYASAKALALEQSLRQKLQRRRERIVQRRAKRQVARAVRYRRKQQARPVQGDLLSETPQEVS